LLRDKIGVVDFALHIDDSVVACELISLRGNGQAVISDGDIGKTVIPKRFSQNRSRVSGLIGQSNSDAGNAALGGGRYSSRHRAGKPPLAKIRSRTNPSSPVKRRMDCCLKSSSECFWPAARATLSRPMRQVGGLSD
jgi:hypothetical protein